MTSVTLFVLAVLLLFASASFVAADDLTDPAVETGAVSDDENNQIKAVLALRTLSVADLGRAQIPIEAVTPELVVLNPTIPLPCRGVEASDVGYVFRFVNGGRFAARKCVGVNCVRISRCPGDGSVKCFEILSCQGAQCLRFKPCCNGQFSLVAADSGVRFVPGKKFLRQSCGTCFNILACPDSASFACESLAPCTGSGCSHIVPCPSTTTSSTTTSTVSTTTTTTTTTTTRPCHGIQLRVAVNGTRLVPVNNLKVPAFKLIPCDAATDNCVEPQACTATDIRSGVKCYNPTSCTSDPNQPRCFERANCTDIPCNGINEVNSTAGYRWVLNQNPLVVPSYKKVACTNTPNCFTLVRCTPDDVKLGLCAIQETCAATTGAVVNCVRQVAC